MYMHLALLDLVEKLKFILYVLNLLGMVVACGDVL